uniref:G-protein coupled receptors family 1 profile domain-containing protein n=1 Tax=Terrapene triunguis TaxID=2587831 RepID=A0A674JLD1_9SAUR
MAENASSPYEYDGDYKDDSSLEAGTRLRGTMHVVSMVIYSIAFVLGVMGNGLVIFITGFRMKRTVNAIWFLNLAVADFIFTFFLPLGVAYVALGFHWPFGRALCKINTAVAFLNMFASIFLLTAISADRCVTVAWPVWAQNHRSPRLASLVAVAVWLAAFALSCPYVVFRDTGSSPFQENVTHCYNNYDRVNQHSQADPLCPWTQEVGLSSTSKLSPSYVPGSARPYPHCHVTIVLVVTHLMSKPHRIFGRCRDLSIYSYSEDTKERNSVIAITGVVSHFYLCQAKYCVRS